MPIESIYPPLNGAADQVCKMLNFVAIPSNCSDQSVKITVLWTRTTTHTKEFQPNHFVPLLKLQTVVPSPITFPTFSHISLQKSPCIDSFDEFPPLSTSSPKSNSSAKQNPFSLTSPNITIQCDTSSSRKSASSSNKLPMGNLTASDVFTAIIDTENVCFEKIPNGQKENVFFVLDNSGNVAKTKNAKSIVSTPMIVAHGIPIVVVQ